MIEFVKFKRGKELLEFPKEPVVIEGNAFLPQRAFIPIDYSDSQRIFPSISRGEVVKDGQPIAFSNGDEPANVHSSIPGNVYDFVSFDFPKGKKLYTAAVRLEGAFNILGKPLSNYSWKESSQSELMNIIDSAGILNTGNKDPVSLAYELVSASKKGIKTVCINLFDNDLSCNLDSILFEKFAEKTAEGAGIIAKALNADSIICIYKSGKSDIKNLEQIFSLCQGIKINFVKANDTYPVIEKFNLKSIKNAVNIDISTAIYTCDAVRTNNPLIDIYVLITGKALNTPKILKVKIGTPIGNLIEECGGFKTKPEHIIINGLMQGFTADNLDIPVTKFLKSISVFGKESIKPFQVQECINCGLCFNSCPLYLEPKKIVRNIEKNVIDEEILHYINICKNCACCSSCCPARIPLSAIIADTKEKLIKGNIL